jgi:hypothetical protein
MRVDWEAADQFVRIAVSLFGIVLYLGFLYAGFMEFISRISKKKVNKKRSQKVEPEFADCAPQRFRESRHGLSGKGISR